MGLHVKRKFVRKKEAKGPLLKEKKCSTFQQSRAAASAVMYFPAITGSSNSIHVPSSSHANLVQQKHPETQQPRAPV